MNAPARLTPTMASRKNLAFAFIKRYLEQWGHSPSYGELAEELGISRSSARALVRRLSDEQMINRRPGRARSMTLPSQHEDALRVLLSLGYTIGVGPLQLNPPKGNALRPGTNQTLPLVPELDHIPWPKGGDQHDSNGTSA